MFVLYATQRLGLDAVGFGLLTTAAAVGGIAGTASYDWLERHASLANTHARRPAHRDLHASRSCAHDRRVGRDGDHGRLRRPRVRLGHDREHGADAGGAEALQGRVAGLYSIGVFGGILVGQALGGVLASAWGVTAPFWFAFVGSAVILALIWRELANIAHAGSNAR